MNKLLRILKYLVVILLAIAVLVIGVSYAIYPAEYVSRVLRWRDADVFDYQKFPNVEIKNSGEIVYYEKMLDEELVRSLFEKDPQVKNLEDFLEETGTQSFIVIHNGNIMYEDYFNGFRRNSIVTSFSMAKSFVSALVGFAIEDGYIRSVNDPITDYLPELLERDFQFGEITIENLMMMSSGIKYVETGFVNGDDAKTYYYPDLRSLALEQTEIDSKPGEYFLYNNFHPLLLGVILERATGMSVSEYLEVKIWIPLGMEYSASWSLDSEETQFEKMESGINARAIDFAKFGEFYLYEGFWMGYQLLPKAWIADATQSEQLSNYEEYYPDGFIFDSGRGYYKYFWWGLTVDQNNYDFTAIGNHGQFIYISPSSNLVIVRNGMEYGVDAKTWLDLFFQFARDIGES